MPPTPISLHSDGAPRLGFGIFIVSAPPPFDRADATELKQDAAAVIARYFPDAPRLFARRGWTLPASLGRVYDPSHALRHLRFPMPHGLLRQCWQRCAKIVSCRLYTTRPMSHQKIIADRNELNGRDRLEPDRCGSSRLRAIGLLGLRSLRNASRRKVEFGVLDKPSSPASCVFDHFTFDDGRGVLFRQDNDGRLVQVNVGSRALAVEF